jgi:hypothetical protein
MTSFIVKLSNDSISPRKGEKKMNKILVVTALSIAIILAVWAIFEPFTPFPLETRSNNAPIPAQAETGGMLANVQPKGAAIPATGADFKVAPMFDAWGAVISDPSGTLLNANKSKGAAVPVTSADFKVAPMFDAWGAVISDPSGTLLNANDR